VTHEINTDLVDVVRELARETTPQELQRRGVRNIRSIGISQVSLLIEKAVNRTLMKRTIGGLSDVELGALVAEAEAEFTAQLAELEVLADSRKLVERQREQVHQDLAALRDAPAPEAPADGDGASGPSAAEIEAERVRDLRLQIQALLLPLYDPNARNRPGVRRLAEQVMALCVADREAALAAQKIAYQDEILQLERRVAKLVQSLETTEKVLDELAKMKDVEHGIASIYRTVQGLATGAFDREKKIEMLERIFLANLDLRAQVAQG
jgi:hypothetical protein